MEIPNNVRKLIYGMFDTMIEGADKYVTKSSTWIIFTEEKRWVFEFTNTKTLWFNYNLFQSELKLLSMDCVESKDIIKEWFESRFLGIDVVEETLSTAGKPLKVEDTIQNGVKHTQRFNGMKKWYVEDTIQNGVKDTHFNFQSGLIQVEDVIQNGVKETYECFNSANLIDDIIQNGVKTTLPEDDIDIGFVENAIQNGVKEINHVDVMKFFDNKMEVALQNGVRHTNLSVKVKANQVEDTIQNGVRHTEVDGMRIRSGVKDAIQEGVKETRFHKSSNLYRIEDTRTLWGKSGDEGVVEYIIQEGVKETTTTRWARKDAVENTIQNGVKHIEDGDWLDQDERIDDIIESGVKETKHRLIESYEQKDHQVTTLEISQNIKNAIENGVKE
jgi:predicted transcriptional regulator